MSSDKKPAYYSKKSAVVVGLGEIGMPIANLCKGTYDDVVLKDVEYLGKDLNLWPVESLNICIPGNVHNFVDVVCDFIKNYEPEVTLIHSTVFPGTIQEIIDKMGNVYIVHSQVHGKHKGNNMTADMLRHKKIVGTDSPIAYNHAKQVLMRMGFPEKNISMIGLKESEYCKLLATSLYGYLISWAQHIKLMTLDLNLKYDELTEFLKLDTDDFDPKNKFPGYIGGHCVLPNLKILQESYPSKVWDTIIERNKLFNEN